MTKRLIHLPEQTTSRSEAFKLQTDQGGHQGERKKRHQIDGVDVGDDIPGDRNLADIHGEHSGRTLIQGEYFSRKDGHHGHCGQVHGHARQAPPGAHLTER